MSRSWTLTVRIAALAAVLMTGACALGPKPQMAVGSYDFGPPAAASTLPLKGLAGIEVTAPRWLDSVNTWYRLGYANPAQPLAYSQPRWVMPPATLIEARLRERVVAGGVVLGGAGPLLKIEIDEFAQVFDAEKSSRGALRARATLHNGREVLRQRQFVIDEPAGSADGPGGVAALSRAADRLVDAALAWAGER